ncbi:MAG TPA: VOC family protein [Phenylobacterium sp.]|jgi:catechol 2,3-dioxygenase-like lactoylglutathione lyase family enzyme|nr:VOC family protein [Phenylobacterium sp.]
MDSIPKLRVARPTDDIDALLSFYRDGFGLSVLYRFAGHVGFDGAILGAPGAPFHFEFTRAQSHSAGRAPTQDHLIVLYLPDDGVWRAAIERFRAAGFEPVRPLNPYWGIHGATFEDPDG